MVHITTPADEFGPFSALLRVPVDVPTGWECPRCKRIYSPQTGQCLPCSPPPQPFTGPLPRPKADPFPWNPAPVFDGLTGSAEPVKRRAPMCKYSLVPAEAPAEACCVCGSTEVTYRNYEDKPFCEPCANGEPDEEHARNRCPDCHMPLAMHHGPVCGQPCGRCEEEKAKEAELARLTVTLPAYLADPHCKQIARVGNREWTEVLPGLQCQLRGEPVRSLVDDRITAADLEFRLAPPDGGQDD